ncbi:hypothetical protein DEIPH_ctg051orf0009 [Deinococcus phoenicis]|uniref:Uncharacterized protein n=1 Tax=Deinococcus phoenicis TaxID=1476583 RepID=A0A016QLV4_9DEIO|nr:hypothetical protein [Deinococcus phoenicis]EYB67105.1 hypothetical protein DEIPH_ctg051orf0009 [Deinococcus phoenicis]
MKFLILIVLLVAVVLFLRLRKQSAGSAQPPGTADLDEETAVRPDIDPAALAAARASVTPAVPDAVLSDALLDATPRQLATMLASVPTEVMAAAVGHDSSAQPPIQARAEDLAQLRKVSEAVDDLEIWSFGDKN